MNTALTTRIAAFFASTLVTVSVVSLIAGYALPEQPAQAMIISAAPAVVTQP